MRTAIILFLVVVAVACVVIAIGMRFPPVAKRQAERANNPSIVVSESTPTPVTDAAIPTPFPPLTEPSRENPTPGAKPKAEPEVAPAPGSVKKPKEALHDPTARVALALVGADPEAEAYWLGAIFDASLPEGEREDLMEDLNEDGLSDRKRPGPQDLPLILNRLALIEGLLPYADDFMMTHLGEAYKDLVNLADITQGRGEPVR